MKILHTSDWHLGKRLERFPRHAEQVLVLQEIAAIADAEMVDVVLIAGDLFDQFNPPAESVDLFYRSLKVLSNNGKRLVFAIAGNHDSPERIEAPDPLARECGIVFAAFPDTEIPQFLLESGIGLLRTEAGFAEFRLPGCSFPLRIFYTPYANEIRLRQYFDPERKEEEIREALSKKWTEQCTRLADTEGVNLMMAHLYLRRDNGAEVPEPDDERPILQLGGAQAFFSHNLPTGIQYCALGHLHQHHFASHEPVCAAYSGSPLAYSFSESNQDKFVLIIELDPCTKPVINPIKLQSGRKLLRKSFDSVAEARGWLAEHQETWVELSLRTETYLSGSDQRLLHAEHKGIVSIIPEVTTLNADDPLVPELDPSGDFEELFRQYFRYSKNADPPPEILSIFRELIMLEEPE